MTTLQFEVQDDMIRLFGMERIKNFLEEELAYQRFRLLEKQVLKALGDAKGVNWDAEFEQARQAAFEEYMNRRKQNK